MPGPLRVAAFVSPHGFGHAARSAAILAALAALRPGIEIEIRTSVPRWFFEESLGFPFRYQELVCDVGLVQRSPVAEDLPATVAALERFWEGEEARVARLAAELAAAGVGLVLCDIAPLGLVAARRAGIPSVLVENFTWDWIFGPLVAEEPGLAPWIPFLRERFALADRHLQLEPACSRAEGSIAIGPVSRSPRCDPAGVRARLDVPDGRALVLVSLGGIEHRVEALAPLIERREAVFVLPGASDREETSDNLRLLPHHSPVHHPDLVAAADVVVGKLGYSTVAEAIAAGTRMLYVPRPGFRESAVLERFVVSRLPSASIAWNELESGTWVSQLAPLLSIPRPQPAPAPGAAMAARELLSILPS
ncbi:MAG: hypothetical protein AB7G12_12265 [Thermoanaerobaculia bacterium]